MNLIKINLNQTVSKAQLEHLKEEKNRWMIFALICTLFIASLSWFYLVNNRLNNIIENRITTINTIKNKTNKLTSEGKINLSKTDINNLYRFQSKRIYWSDKLLELAKITPEDMVIDKFEYKGKRLNISAISHLNHSDKEFTVVGNFMTMISENNEFNNDFKDIKFGFLDKEFSNKQELLSFKIEAKLK